MKIDIKQLTKLIESLKSFVKKYATFVIVLIGLGIFGFLVLRIRTLASQEPSDSIVQEKTGKSGSTTIDKSAAEKVQKLQETNVDVKAIFDNSRDNPFQE